LATGAGFKGTVGFALRAGLHRCRHRPGTRISRPIPPILARVETYECYSATYSATGPGIHCAILALHNGNAPAFAASTRSGW
jgi:hypothetical protein